MNSKSLHLNLRRFSGCTLTGALSVTTQVKDGITVIHGPDGCVHHNLSLFHALSVDNGSMEMPALSGSGMDQDRIIFGGEDALESAIKEIISSDSSIESVFVLSTCVAETIGDDTRSVCAKEYGIPVIFIPTSGFLGGVFQNGFENALRSLALQGSEDVSRQKKTVNIVGEKNLEFEVEGNYSEMGRILDLLGLDVNVRHVRGCYTRDLYSVGDAALNILRDRSVCAVGEYLMERYGTGYLDGFPIGFSGTLEFIRKTGDLFAMDVSGVLHTEHDLQSNIIDEFSDISGSKLSFTAPPQLTVDAVSVESVIDELCGLFDLSLGKGGIPVPYPFPGPVGTMGTKRLLHRWRRIINA